MRIRLLAAEGESEAWSPVAFGGGIAAGVLLVANVTPGVAAALAADVLGPAVAQAVGLTETAFFIGAAAAAAVLVLSTGL